jgi:hypothetical protein
MLVVADQLDALLLAQGAVVAEVHSHAAQPDGRNFQFTFPVFPILFGFGRLHNLNLSI